MVDAADRPEAEGGSHARDASQQLAALRRDSRQSPSAGSDEPSNAQIVRRAMDRYRMLAEAMLNRGDRIGGDTGARLIIYSTHMLLKQDAVERLLHAFSDGSLSPNRSASVQAELVRFTRGVQAGLSRVPMTETPSPERVAMELLQPLRMACEEASSRQAVSGWWQPVADSNAPLDSSEAELEEAFQEIEIDEVLRVTIESLPSESRLYRSSIELLVKLDSYSWVNGPARRAVKETLQSEVEAAQLSIESREASTRRIEAMHELVAAMGRLASAPGGRAVATRRSDVFEDILVIWPDQYVPPATAMAIADTIDILAQARGEEDDGLSRFRTRVHVDLSRQRLQAERRIFESFNEVAASRSPWTDPGLVVILSEPRHLLEAMQRLRQLDTWSEAAQQASPAVANALIHRLETLVGSMADLRTREDAARALDEFERQFELFESMDAAILIGDSPFDPGGRIMRSISRARSGWMSEWSNERSAGDAANELYRYHRLLDHVKTLRRLTDLGYRQAGMLPAWILPDDLLESKRAQFQEELLAYSRALADGDEKRIGQLQTLLESEFATLRLVAFMAAAVPPQVAQATDLHSLGLLMIRPEPGSRFLQYRPALARIGHGLLDADFLVRQERFEEAEALLAWTNEEAMRVLRRLSVTPSPPLAVPGMRDGDAGIDPGMMEMMR